MSTAQYLAAHNAAMQGQTWTCPRCGKQEPAPDFPALSRKDNATAVCSPCGVDEALQQFAGRDPWPAGGEQQ